MSKYFDEHSAKLNGGEGAGIHISTVCIDRYTIWT
jgi:hypothetical protein